MRPEPKSAEQLQKAVKDFNRDFPDGTPVILRKDLVEIKTTVNGIAFVLGGHSAIENGRVSHASS